MNQTVMISAADYRRCFENFMQNFAEAVQGKKIIYLYRVKGESSAAYKIAFTTENSRTVSKDADSTATKDGSIRTPGVAEVEISATAILAANDDTIDKLEVAMLDDKLIEIWEVNLQNKGSTGKYKGRYFEGYLTESETTSSAEDMVEVSLTFGINGNGEKGEITVTAEQEEMAKYVFKDATQATAEQ